MYQEIPRYLYIHWPFCHRKCHFCDFVAYQQQDDYQEAYHSILCQEVSSFAHQFESSDRKIHTIFLGGGTPSIYPLPMLAELWTTLNSHYDLTALQEASIESNPADITEERLIHGALLVLIGSAWAFKALTKQHLQTLTDTKQLVMLCRQ